MPGLAVAAVVVIDLVLLEAWGAAMVTAGAAGSVQHEGGALRLKYRG